MTLPALFRSCARGAATTIAVLGIVAASMVGLHEWADAETTRGIIEPSGAAATATTIVQATVASATAAGAARAGEEGQPLH